MRWCVAGLSGLVLACGADPGSPYSLDNVLRLNHVQAKGTHNSYHLEPEEPFHDSHRYSHAPLDIQLEQQGVRQFELDLHRHHLGHFEVFHLPGGVDEGTTCRRFVDCLRVTKTWSDAHPFHLPVVFWLEPKDLEFDWVSDEYVEFVGDYGELESEIRSVWPDERVLRPDDVRGPHSTLPEAIAATGWPTLGELRGKAIFVLLDASEHREAYVAPAENLQGRTLFVGASTATSAFAGFFKINNAGAEASRVRALAEAGFIITSNVDGPEASDADNQARFEGALEAGAHFLSSDLPARIPGREYFADLPLGAPARCHPYGAPPACTPAEVENLSAR